MHRLHIGIAGAGAVGCHYGSRLLQAGCHVTFLARGAHLQALQRDGLHHQTLTGTHRFTVTATDQPAALADCDVVLLCCKMTGLPAMLAALQGQLRSDALLITLQNGVEAPAAVAAAFPQHPIIAGTAFIGARRTAPGAILHSAAGGLRLASWRESGQQTDPRLEQLLAALHAADVPTRLESDADAMLWRKLLWNCGFNAMTALTRQYAKQVAADAELCALVREAMAEAVSVAQRAGIAIGQEDIDKHIAVTLAMGEVKTSMWQDLEADQRTEVDFINGTIVRQASALQIPAPINRMLTALIHAQEQQLSRQ